MTNPQLWALFIGFVSPPAIAVVQQPRWSGPARAFFMLLASLLIGVGTAYFNDALHAATVATNLLIAAVAVGTSYHSLWKPAGIAPGIEAATSPGSTTVRSE
ncbi:hypothetical protein [Streptomyces sp. NPDC050738]|uniref:hypothetical protein n=1 Tax=Streptomyces sp. NPDC050738 TaxID=3154744 RepID=UPI0034484DE3